MLELPEDRHPSPSRSVCDGAERLERELFRVPGICAMNTINLDDAAAGKPSRTLIFVHIPKSGGTTLRGVIARHYAADATLNLYPEARPPGKASDQVLAEIPGAKKRALQLVYGHIAFGLHTALPENACTYLTFLRDPVDRVVSYFHHARRQPLDPLHRRIHEENLSLDDVMDRLPEFENGYEFQNRQAFAIAGLCLERFQATPPESLLSLAIANLDKHFLLAGIMEQFDQSLLLAGREAGWKHLHYRRANVDPRRTKRTELPDSTRRKIERLNEVDLALYELARRRIREQIGELGAAFRLQVALFQIGNALRQRYWTLRRKMGYR